MTMQWAGFISNYIDCRSRTEVLVHKSIKDEQMLVENDQPFPTVEFGFEYFFAMVVSKVYRV